MYSFFWFFVGTTGLSLLFVFCMYTCLRSNGRKITNRYSGTPIAVTQVTTTARVQPPYPTHALHPTPQSVQLPASQPVQPPAPGFVPIGSYQTLPYPPVPGAGPGGAPYPPMNTPYPPTPYSPTEAAPPPSYSEAVVHAPVQPPPVEEKYAKQAPYNPNY